MKRFILMAAAAALLAIPAAEAQKVNKEATLSKLEKSDADIANPKKNAKAATWINRGRVYYDAAAEPTANLFAPMETTLLKLSVNVLGEYGGIGLPVEGHLWSADKNWGYIEFKTREDVTDRYVTYAEKLMELVERGFSAAVYTQTTDVEGEVNGLVTYDREVVKVDVDRLHEVNRRLVRSLDL